MFKKIFSFFDKLEDKTRGFLSHYPTVYAVIGGIGLILFWRGIWEGSIAIGMTNLGSTIIGALILLSTGIFVSYFIGDQILLSGLRGEKKMIEKTESELENEANKLDNINHKLNELKEMVEKLSAK
ncbi:MAG: hypothetical protein WCW56_02865 [Candidatus Paceibacterota bacterium]|jgi:hypothetical protein